MNPKLSSFFGVFEIKILEWTIKKKTFPKKGFSQRKLWKTFKKLWNNQGNWGEQKWKFLQ